MTWRNLIKCLIEKVDDLDQEATISYLEVHDVDAGTITTLTVSDIDEAPPHMFLVAEYDSVDNISFKHLALE